MPIIQALGSGVEAGEQGVQSQPRLCSETLWFKRPERGRHNEMPSQTNHNLI